MDAVISSRTPEGEPFRCPICGTSDRIEPSRPPGDAPCPACGHLIYFPRRLSRERIEAVLRTDRRRPMFGVVATISRQVRGVFERHRARQARRREATGVGVYDPWIDGDTGH